MSSVVIDFQDTQGIIHPKSGETLLAALRREGYSLPAACGGRGRCGKCRVTVNGVQRLACKVIPMDGDRVVLPEHSGGKILTETLPLQVGALSNRNGYVAAVDLGTTTIALRLYKLTDATECCTLTEWNKQSSFGADVISRMDYCMGSSERLAELQSIVRTQCEAMLRAALQEAAIALQELRVIVLAGNTVMQHLCAGYPPDGIAVAPFTPTSLFTEEVKDELLGVPLHYAPCVSGYVGGDITAGLLATEMHRKAGNYLFLDIGTNGEMALGGRDGLLCCAVASGPAFEGAGITCGMPGVDGAISHVRYENGLLYDVIGTVPPQGICGSGLIDLVSELLRQGCIDEGGRLLPPEEAPAHMRRYLSKDADGNGIFQLHKNVLLTARDVRNLQLAKAAVAGGIAVLLANAGITMENIDGIYLAGGFGTYIKAANAVHIGLLPVVSSEKLHVVGNTSLAGAARMALSERPLEIVLPIAEQMKYLELSGRKDFADAFTANMHF